MNHLTTQPQDITLPTGGAAIFMVFGLGSAPDAVEKIKSLCLALPQYAQDIQQRAATLEYLSYVMGFGSDAWDALFPEHARPKELHPLPEYKGAKHTAVSTPGDVFFHLRAERMDLCFELAMNIRNHLGDAVVFIDEVQGFRYFDARSMVGFVDGTENPEGQEALAATVIGAEDPDFSGGSYAVVQKYLHDMTSWNELPEKIQEHVIGRTKADDIELSDEEKPANAHNAVTNIEDEDGNELKIMRANLPFGNPAAGEFGTYFIGYAKTPSITERMLSNMFIGEPVGNYDRLLDFSTAVTGTLFFIPSRPLLQQLGA
ncbi:Dyp-type peroxidase [Neisseriaceae bacterium CLB008]